MASPPRRPAAGAVRQFLAAALARPDGLPDRRGDRRPARFRRPVRAAAGAPRSAGDHAATGLQPPSRAYPLGTDELGRDILSRLIYAARTSLLVALGSVAVAGAIGVPLGLLAGYAEGLARQRDHARPRRDPRLPGHPAGDPGRGLARHADDQSGADDRLRLHPLFHPAGARQRDGGQGARVTSRRAGCSGRGPATWSWRVIFPNVLSPIDRPGLAVDVAGGPDRGGAQLPRRRRPGADARLGLDAAGVAALPGDRRPGTSWRPAPASSSRSWPSTWSATGCGTCSILGAGGRSPCPSHAPPEHPRPGRKTSPADDADRDGLDISTHGCTIGIHGKLGLARSS